MKVSPTPLVPRILGGVLVLAIMAWAGLLLARSGGITGLSQSATGCSCHSSTPNANGNVTVSITGPQQVVPESISGYTLTVSGGPPATQGGFNLSADGGDLIAGANNQLLSGELTHIDENSRSWTFQWKAPVADGTYNFFAVGQATDGGGNAKDDSWNWYGDAAGTGYAIEVKTLVGVETPGAMRLALEPATPNPFVTSTRLSFTLPRGGPIQLDILDPRGRKVATLVREELAPGRHAAGWDGSDGLGNPVAPGVYFARLRALGEVITTKIAKASL